MNRMPQLDGVNSGAAEQVHAKLNQSLRTLRNLNAVHFQYAVRMLHHHYNEDLLATKRTGKPK